MAAISLCITSKCYWGLWRHPVGWTRNGLWCWAERRDRVPQLPVQLLQENAVVVHVLWHPGVPIQTERRGTLGKGSMEDQFFWARASALFAEFIFLTHFQTHFLSLHTQILQSQMLPTVPKTLSSTFPATPACLGGTVTATALRSG